MKSIVKRATIAAAAATFVGATMLTSPPADAAQGPHHHPTAIAGGQVVTDELITVYRDNPNAGRDRWCVRNYHRVGAVSDASFGVEELYYRIPRTTPAGGWNPFPYGGGHTQCTVLRTMHRGQSTLEVRLDYILRDGLEYGLDLSYHA